MHGASRGQQAATLSLKTSVEAERLRRTGFWNAQLQFLGLSYLEFFSNSVWHAKQYLQGIAFLRFSGIGSPHSSQLIADSPV